MFHDILFQKLFQNVSNRREGEAVVVDQKLEGLVLASLLAFEGIAAIAIRADMNTIGEWRKGIFGASIDII